MTGHEGAAASSPEKAVSLSKHPVGTLARPTPSPPANISVSHRCMMSRRSGMEATSMSPDQGERASVGGSVEENILCLRENEGKPEVGADSAHELAGSCPEYATQLE